MPLPTLPSKHKEGEVSVGTDPLALIENKYAIYRNVCADGRVAVVATAINDPTSGAGRRNSATCGKPPARIEPIMVQVNQNYTFGFDNEAYRQYRLLRGQQIFESPCLAWRAPDATATPEQKKLLKEARDIAKAGEGQDEQVVSVLKERLQLQFECNVSNNDHFLSRGGARYAEYVDRHYEVLCDSQERFLTKVRSFANGKSQLNISDCSHKKELLQFEDRNFKTFRETYCNSN